MDTYLMGIDIGTSACKVAVFATDGTVIASESEEYPVYYPKEGWAEQNPEEWWEAAGTAIRRMVDSGKIYGGQIAGIGVGGQSWSAIAVDAAGEVLCNTPIWMDTRAQEICCRIQEEIGEERIFGLAGNSIQPSYTTAKVIWYRENRPDIYSQIDQILQSNAYLVYRLTGIRTTDLSQAYGFHCFDMKNGRWDENLCSDFGIPMSFLPPLYECSEVVGYLTEMAAMHTGILAGIPVVAGGLDAACGTLGAGVVRPGETQEQGGQAGGMSICLEQYQADPRLILSRHVVPGRWLLQGGTTGGAGVMRWLEREFGAYERLISEGGKSSLQQLNEIAESIPAGSDGMIFLPYMAGERSPIWDPCAKGVYYGLDYAKTKGHLIRASMEGVAYSLLHNLVAAERCGAKVTELTAMGGAANSILWTQIKADVTGKPIKVPASDTATTWGAAILAGVGVGIYGSCEEAVDQTVRIQRMHLPNKENYSRYQCIFPNYIRLYENLKDMMKLIHMQEMANR